MPSVLVRLLGGVACLALLGPVAAQTDEAARVRAAVETAVVPLMARHQIPGMAVAVTVQGRSYVMNFGVASRESGQPVNDATIFEIGSLTKPLTATLAAYAEAAGKLSFADRIGTYVHELRGTPIDRATLLHLGTYTAGGLPLQFPDAVSGRPATLAYYGAWVAPAQPGAQRLYSNPSLGLLGMAASQALGQGFADAMTSIVFPAFGMRSSFIDVPERVAADYAWGYRGDRAVRVSAGPMDEETYGVKTTATDMLRFVQGNMDPGALAEPMRQAVQRTHIGHFRAGPLVQGLGWEQYPYPVSREWLLGGNAVEMILGAQPVQQIPGDDGQGARLFNKTGSTGGFGAYALFVPTEKFGIVMLANRNYPNPARVEVAAAILQALVGKAP